MVAGHHENKRLIQQGFLENIISAGRIWLLDCLNEAIP